MGHRFLSFGRPLDALGRRNKLVHALSAARRVGADHVVISGDLTEIGSPGEFECLGEALHDRDQQRHRAVQVNQLHLRQFARL